MPFVYNSGFILIHNKYRNIENRQNVLKSRLNVIVHFVTSVLLVMSPRIIDRF